MPPPSTDERRVSAYLQVDAAAELVAPVAYHWDAAAELVASAAYHYCKEDTAGTADIAGIPPRFPASVAAAIVVAYHTDRYPSCLP